MPDLIKPSDEPHKKLKKSSPLRTLIKIFRTNSVVKHHFQSPRSDKPVGVAKAFFKSGYQFQSSVIPGYSAYDRFARYCIAGDTLVATNNEDGFLRMDELVQKHEAGEDIHIFAYDKIHGNYVLAPISKAWKTKNDQIWEVELDDGSILRCTKDHPIMLKDGSFREAQNLKEGDALMAGNYETILEKIKSPDFIKKELNLEHASVAKRDKGTYKDIPEQLIYNSYKKGMTCGELSEEVGVSPGVLCKRITTLGYEGWSDFRKRYVNHKVACVRKTEVWEDVYDLTVPGYHNFAIIPVDKLSLAIKDKSRKSLISISNSDYAEMESFSILSKALDIVADEITQKDEDGRIIRIDSENKDIKEILTELFDDILHLNGKDIYKLARALCKYGDVFYLIDATEEHGVINLINMPANEIDREEGFDKEEPSAVRFRWNRAGSINIPNAYVAHFRLDGNDLFKPFGQSFLEAARRPWRQLILLEDAMMIYRITRAPERRVYYLDVMGIPPESIDEVVAKFNQTIKKEKIVNEQGKVDLRYGSTMPVWKDTPIPLLDGRTITIKELADEHEAGKENWVYSNKDDTLETVPGKIVWCGKNYTAEKMIKVWLDDETWIMTAPEHPFEVWEDDSRTKKKSVRADKLRPGDSLVALYKDYNSKRKILKGYERVWCHKNKKYNFTHRIVGETALQDSKKLLENNSKYMTDNRYLVVHHKDFNKLNNAPDNLEWVGNIEHGKYHKETARKNLIEWNKSERKRRLVSKLNKERNSVQHMSWYNGSELHRKHDEIRRRAQLAFWADEENKKERMKKVSAIRLDNHHVDEIYKISRRILEANDKISRDKFGEILNQQQDYIDLVKEAHVAKPKCGKYSMHIRTLLRHLGVGFNEFKIVAINNGLNHKVLMIEEIFESDDVYCMTVVGPNDEDDRHNFAALTFDKDGNISKSAILLKNSMEEDLVVPVRGQETGTRIDTLPGGQNASDIEDIEFIKKNLFAALGIPKAFLTFDEDVGAKSLLTQEDIRFARTVSRIQEAIINELLKIAIIHLYLKGIRGKDLINFEIKMTNPSTVAELQKNELWRARMELVQQAGEGVFDTTFIYKNFLHLSDEAIDMIRKGQIMDKMFQSKLLQIEGGGMATGLGGEGLGGLGGMGGLGGGMGAGIGGMGGGLESFGGGEMGGGMPNLGGAEPNVAGLPMESFNPAAAAQGPGHRTDLDGTKQDLRRNHNERISTKRGYEENSGLVDAGDVVDDTESAFATDTIRRSYSSPMGANESKLVEFGTLLSEYRNLSKKVYDNMLENIVIKNYPFLRASTKKASECNSITAVNLTEEFGGSIDDKNIILNEDIDTKIVLTETLKDNFKESLEISEAKIEKILNSIYNKDGINISRGILDDTEA